MRLIDADNLVKCVELIQARTAPKLIVSLINSQITIPAEIITYGDIVSKGEGTTRWHECSKCGTPVDLGDKRCRNCPAQFVREVVKCT